MPSTAHRPRWTLAGLALLAVAAPSPAHPGHDEILVTGRSLKDPNRPQSAARTVSFADLDLSTPGGKKELDRRVAVTVRYLCKQLGESEAEGVGASCQQDAMKRARERVGYAVSDATPRSKSWVPGPAWKPPGE